MAVNGRTKGSAYEREIARQIVEAFAPWGITAEHCFRTPLSGGHKFACKTDPGDLQIHADLLQFFWFSTECKFHRGINWIELFKPSAFTGFIPKKNASGILDWWKQTCLAASKHKVQKPLLVMKQNRSDSYCVLRQKDYQALLRELKGKPPITLMLGTKLNGDLVRVLFFSELLKMLVMLAKRKSKR
jgi:hypothetical protein